MMKPMARARLSFLFIIVLVLAVLAGGYAVLSRGGGKTLRQRLLPPAGKQTALSLSPSKDALTVGKEATVSLVLDSGGRAVDAVDVDLTYDPQVLEVLKVEPQDIFAQYPIKSGKAGRIRIAGLAAAGPSGPQAFTGRAELAKIILKPKKAVPKATLNFSDKSIVASKGKNVLEKTGNGEYQITP
jgi:hypothetical protein